MENLARSVGKLKSTPISGTIRRRMGEFRSLGSSGPDSIFKELCFCILTANYSADGGIRIQKEIGDGFLTLDEGRLASRLRGLGYRFPNMRARYIVQSRARRAELEDAMSRLPPRELRAWLAGNIYGLGYKEASHFLRNIGHTQFAIIDFHIIDILAEHGVIQRPKTKSLSRGRYEEIESRLAELSRKSGITQGELDLYLWYMETGKVLK